MTRCYCGLKRRSDFRRIYEKGSSWANRFLVLYIAKESASGRVGFSVGKRVGNAVRRNLVKRRLKEITNTLLTDMTLDRDCIILARTGASTATYYELFGALSDLLRRAKVLY